MAIHLSVAKQVCGCAGVEQGSENLPHGLLNFFLQDGPPLSGIGLSAVCAGVDHTLRQVRQELIHII